MISHCTQQKRQDWLRVFGSFLPPVSFVKCSLKELYSCFLAFRRKFCHPRRVKNLPSGLGRPWQKDCLNDIVMTN